MLLPDGYTTDQASELAKKYKNATGKEVLDDLLKEYYNAYISIGGYPAVVNTFLKELDMRTVYDLYDKLLKNSHFSN